MMLEYMQRINKDNVTDSMMMDVILKIKMTYFFSSNKVSFKYRKYEKQDNDYVDDTISAKNCTYLELLWSVFSHIGTEYGPE